MASIPTVTTGAISSITSKGAIASGNITSDGGATITGRGVQYSTTQNADKSVDETGTFSTGAFSETLASLYSNNLYYVRAYATNSAGTGYGSWVSFSTLQNVYSVVIAGIDRTADVITGKIQIEDNINDKSTVCQLTLVDRRNLGVPETDDEIVITLDSGVRIFGGRILRRSKTILRGTYVEVVINCLDYTRDFDRHLVNKTYTSQTDQAVIQDIVDTFCEGSGITYANVLSSATIDKLPCNYIQPSKLMRKISDLTGMNWYLDYDKDLHYFPLTENPAPFNITDSQTFASGQGYFNFQISDDASQLKNRIYVRGGTKLSDPTSYSTKGDGTKRQFVLPDKPHAVTVTVNGTPKTLGIFNVDTSGFDYYLNFQEKYLVQDSGAVVLSTTDVLTVAYTYDIPILVSVEDTVSIMDNGVQEFVIVDPTISTTQAARDRASAELTDYANNLVEGQFQTYTDGFRAGQYVNVDSDNLGIDNQDYIVQKVTATSIGGGNFIYNVALASSKTMGIIRFLLELLENNKNLVQVSDDEVIDELFTVTDSLLSDSLIDSLTIDSFGPYSTWATDSLHGGLGTAKWSLFQWK